MENRELKPCKCGNIPELVEIPVGVFVNKGLRYMVKCFNCKSSLGFWISPNDAIDDWNRRADNGT